MSFIVMDTEHDTEHAFSDVNLARRKLVALGESSIRAYMFVEKDLFPDTLIHNA